MNRYGPDADEAARIAEHAGCRIVESYQLHDGSWAHDIRCESNASKVKFLAELAEYDAHVPDVRRLAELVVQRAGATTPIDQAAALHAFVRDGVTFTKEIRETFSPTMRTIELALGDCDDSARALLALLRTLGHRAGLETIPPWRDADAYNPVHVAAQLWTPTGWQWLETTIAAEPGEHPLEAKQRLGVTGREDIAG